MKQSNFEVCENCLSVHARTKKRCPHCGHYCLKHIITVSPEFKTLNAAIGSYEKISKYKK